MNIESWLQKYEVDCRLKYGSYATQKNYINGVKMFLNYFINDKEPKTISTDEIKKYILICESFNTRNHRLCAIKSFYSLTVGMNVKLENIPFPKREKKIPRIIDAELLKEKILKIENKKHKAILAVAFCCGLRVSEVVNLKIEDIKGKEKIIFIRNAKGRKDRAVGVSETTLEILRDYYKEFSPVKYLFNGQKSGQYTTRSCEEIYHKYIDEETSFHNLRHSQITSLIDKGTNQLAVQVASGHTRSQTTEIYYHASPKFLSQIQAPI